MRHLSFLVPLLFVSASQAACAAPVDEDSTVDTTEAAISSVKLEKSRIEAWLDQKNTTSSVSGECLIESTKFRIVYENPTLPSGTKVTLHVGENAADQQYIGDGFGWGSWREAHWQNVKDLDMPKTGSKHSIEVDGHPYTRFFENWNAWPMPGQWEMQTYGATIQFVFRLQLPDGKVLWDNRLRQDYWVNGNGPGCPGGSTNGFKLQKSWGPF